MSHGVCPRPSVHPRMINSALTIFRIPQNPVNRHYCPHQTRVLWCIFEYIYMHTWIFTCIYIYICIIHIHILYIYIYILLLLLLVYIYIIIYIYIFLLYIYVIYIYIYLFIYLFIVVQFYNLLLFKPTFQCNDLHGFSESSIRGVLFNHPKQWYTQQEIIGYLLGSIGDGLLLGLPVYLINSWHSLTWFFLCWLTSLIW